MKQSHNVYHPSTLIRDFYDPATAYYHSEDVAWSPFTKIGQLSNSPRKALPVTAPRKRPNPVRTPVFPTGFSLEDLHRTRQPQSTNRGHNSHIHQGMMALLAMGFVRMVSKIVTRLKHSVAEPFFLPKKYSLKRGVYVDTSTKMRALIALGVSSVAVLFAILLGPRSHGPVLPSPRPISTAQPLQTQTIMTTANHAVQITPPSRSNETADNTASTVVPAPNAPIVGGMGAGPVDTTVPPVTDPTVPTDTTGGTTVLPPVTVPGVTVQLGDTPLVQTDPTTVGL